MRGDEEPSAAGDELRAALSHHSHQRYFVSSVVRGRSRWLPPLWRALCMEAPGVHYLARLFRFAAWTLPFARIWLGGSCCEAWTRTSRFFLRVTSKGMRLRIRVSESGCGRRKICAYWR